MEEKQQFNIWEYLYYRTTVFYQKTESKYGFEDNKRRGAYVVGLLVSLNIQSLILIIMTFTFNKTDTLIQSGGYFFIGTFLLITLYSLYLFGEKKHDNIFKKFENETQKDKEKRTSILIIYIVLTVILLLATVYIGREYWK
jgi:archaellum biogenesis protein FlaJ (TadC family)